MNVLVTGSEGFVGRHLVDRLLAEGHEVTATALDGRGPRDGTGPRDGPVPSRIRLDVLDRKATNETVSGARPDIVFHMAGFSSGAKARARPDEALRINAEGTLVVLEAVADRAPGARVVVPSSADVYGEPSADPVTEDAMPSPTTAYGVSKAAQELVAVSIANARDLDVRAARLFPLVGPGQAPTFVVPSFCRQAAAIAAGAADPILHVGNLDVERDFMDVRDGVAALLTLAGVESPRHRIYNVCSGRGTRIRELLDWIIEEAGIDPEIRVDPDRVRKGEPARIVGSAERLASETGWESVGDVRDGVRETYSWVRRSIEIH